MRGTVSRLATAARTRDEALELGAHALDAHGRHLLCRCLPLRERRRGRVVSGGKQRGGRTVAGGEVRRGRKERSNRCTCS